MKLILTGLAGAAEAACGARSAPSDSGTATAIAIIRSLLIGPPGSGFAPGRMASSQLLTVTERDISQACGRTHAARKPARSSVVKLHPQPDSAHLSIRSGKTR